MTDPVTIADAALKAGEMLAPEVVKTGAGWVGRKILGTPAERGMRDVYTRSIAGLLIEVAKTSEGAEGTPDPEAMKVAESVLGELCAVEESAGLLLNVALRPGPVPVEAVPGPYAIDSQMMAA